MPKCHFKEISGFTTPGFFNAKASGSLSSGFPVFRILNFRNDLTAQIDHDQWSSLILDTKVMGLSAPIYLASTLDPTVSVTSGVLLEEF
jgi:hypothetical protein